MPFGRSFIRVKALAVIIHADGERHAVWRGEDPTKPQPSFHRPLGGGIELGERSGEAVVREITEELEATLVDARLLGVLESIFVFSAEHGHEIVFVYAGRLAEADAIPEAGRVYHDNGEPNWVEWRPIAGDPGVPLYPDGLQALIDEHLRA